MDKPDAKRERRHQRRCESIGTNNHVCLTCVNPNLKPYNFQEHHIAHKRYDLHATEYICKLCHDDRSEEQRDHPPRISTSENPSRAECAARYSLGLSDMLLPASRVAAYYGRRLIEEAARRALPPESQYLLREAGQFLNTLSPFEERSAHRLKEHAINTINELHNAAERKRNGRGKHKSGRSIT
jgi:hypothetical protein